MKPPRTTRVICLAMMLAAAFASPLATTPEAADEPARRAAVPRNVATDDWSMARLEEAVVLSPTLQRQFAAIEDALVVVEIRVSLAPRTGFRRAEATIGRYESGFVRARIVLRAGTEFVELLAHELEHVLEQLECVNLEALVDAGTAMRDGNGAYETDRARHAGLTAAAEVERGLQALKAAH